MFSNDLAGKELINNEITFKPLEPFGCALVFVFIVSLFIRNATVNDLFTEAKASGQLEAGEVMLGNLRLVEIISNKIFSITRPEQTLESLQVCWEPDIIFEYFLLF